MALTGFFGMFGLYKGFQTVQVGAPEAAIVVEPVIHGPQRLGIELVDAVPAFAVLSHQVGPAKKAQVFGDGGTGNGKGSGDFSGRLAAAAQQVKDGPPRRIGQSLKGRFGRICNCTVTHNA
jgi:hypothetical protein